MEPRETLCEYLDAFPGPFCAIATAGSALWAGARWYVGAEIAAGGARDCERSHRFSSRAVDRAIQAWWPGHPDVAYLIGFCDRRTGRTERRQSLPSGTRADRFADGGASRVGVG